MNHRNIVWTNRAAARPATARVSLGSAVRSKRTLLGLAFGATLAMACVPDPEAQQAEQTQGATKTNETKSPSEFMRFVSTDKDHASLDAAIVRYEDSQGRIVDLIAAVHVGDPLYYSTLNTLFKGYDALLYEMVKPKDFDPAKIGKGKSGSLISQFQRGLKDVLKLEFQLDGIDYGAKNFVHADLDPETFERLMEERGESILLLMLKAAMDQAKRMEAGSGDEDPIAQQLSILAALMSKDSAKSLKLVLGKQFGDLEKVAAGFETGPRGEESVLVVARNKAALEALGEQLEKGHKRLGIFYGAAHLPDMERRLETEFGMKRTRQTWLTAWDIR